MDAVAAAQPSYVEKLQQLHDRVLELEVEVDERLANVENRLQNALDRLEDLEEKP